MLFFFLTSESLSFDYGPCLPSSMLLVCRFTSAHKPIEKSTRTSVVFSGKDSLQHTREEAEQIQTCQKKKRGWRARSQREEQRVNKTSEANVGAPRNWLGLLPVPVTAILSCVRHLTLSGWFGKRGWHAGAEKCDLSTWQRNDWRFHFLIAKSAFVLQSTSKRKTHFYITVFRARQPQAVFISTNRTSSTSRSSSSNTNSSTSGRSSSISSSSSCGSSNTNSSSSITSSGTSSTTSNTNSSRSSSNSSRSRMCTLSCLRGRCLHYFNRLSVLSDSSAHQSESGCRREPASEAPHLCLGHGGLSGRCVFEAPAFCPHLKVKQFCAGNLLSVTRDAWPIADWKVRLFIDGGCLKESSHAWDEGCWGCWGCSWDSSAFAFCAGRPRLSLSRL